MIIAELESNPNTVWQSVGKRLLGKLIKYGVRGRWEEVELFEHVTFLSEFLYQWPFIKGMVDIQPYDSRMSFEKTVMRGTSAQVLRQLVQDFKLEEANYPINLDVNEPVLLISDHPDDSPDEAELKTKSKTEQKLLQAREQKNAIIQKRKREGPYQHVRHQYGLGEDGNVGDLFLN